MRMRSEASSVGPRAMRRAPRTLAWPARGGREALVFRDVGSHPRPVHTLLHGPLTFALALAFASPSPTQAQTLGGASADPLLVPVCAGVFAVLLAVGLGVLPAYRQVRQCRALPAQVGERLGLLAAASAAPPTWWVGELDGRTIGVTAVGASVSSRGRHRTRILLRLGAAIRVSPEPSWHFRSQFTHPRPDDPAAVFAKLPDVPEGVRVASLAFLDRWSGLYVGPATRLQRDPPAAFAFVAVHDTPETDLSTDELYTRLHALIAVAESVERRAR